MHTEALVELLTPRRKVKGRESDTKGPCINPLSNKESKSRKGNRLFAECYGYLA